EQFKAEYQRSLPPLKVAHQSCELWGMKLFQWEKTVPAQKLTTAQKRALAEQSRYRVVNRVVQGIGAGLEQPITLDYGQFLRHYTNQLALPFLVLTNLSPAQIARFQEKAGDVAGLDLEVQPLRV